MKCPSCSAETSGKFCNNCGASLQGARCASCGTDLTPGARFCHICGTPPGSRARSQGNLLPWFIAGAAVVTLLVVVLVLGPASPRGADTAPPAGAPMGTGAGPAPDISSMTPRERADRLFDRIMTAAERGDTSQVRFFRPMALQAYALLGPPDTHIRYDVGMVHAMSGDPEAATAQADSIERAEPGNLLALLIRGAVAGNQSDTNAIKGLYRTFLSRYDQELAMARPGYAEHQGALTAFRDAARQARGAGS